VCVCHECVPCVVDGWYVCVYDMSDAAVSCNFEQTSETAVLKLFAFVTCLIRVLSGGLQTFKLARYRQLNKRIGRLIRYSTYTLLPRLLTTLHLKIVHMFAVL